MQVRLMFPDRDFDISERPCYGHNQLLNDLGLERILRSIASDDKAVYDSCSAAVFNPLQTAAGIEYRQAALRDAFENPELLAELYEISDISADYNTYSSLLYSGRNITSISWNVVSYLKLFVKRLKKLRQAADTAYPLFKSEGFSRFCSEIKTELSDKYLSDARSLLRDLSSREDALVSATLGERLQGVNFTLLRQRRTIVETIKTSAPQIASELRLTRESDVRGLAGRRDKALAVIASALLDSAAHLESYFNQMRAELAFFVGCLSFRETLRQNKAPCCIPSVFSSENNSRSWRDLRDACIALYRDNVVGNDAVSNDTRLYVITGANQGGKSTFLRSIGQAQLMSQCGMPVAAESFSAPIRSGVFTHFKKEEDKTIKSGKLDEEFRRLSMAVDNMDSDALVLLNEPFVSTNEREGSEVCRQVTRALTGSGVEVFLVTHQYTCAAALTDEEKSLFLRAERLENKERTFKIKPGEPLQTAYGEDLYERIFG